MPHMLMDFGEVIATSNADLKKDQGPDSDGLDVSEDRISDDGYQED